MRKRFQHLNVDQALIGLHYGFELMAAGGQVYFRDGTKMMRQTGLHTNTLNYSTFKALRNRELIAMDEANSNLPPENSVLMSQYNNFYAIWKLKERK